MNIPHNFHYFSKSLSLEVKEIYLFTVINAMALALTYIFEPIYLFQLGYTIPEVLWFYVLVYVCYCALMFVGAKFASRFGFKHSILVSSITFVIYWIVLYNIKHVPELFYIAPIFLAMQKSFFWPAFQADIALSSLKKQRGRETATLLSIVEVFSIIGPLIGGILSQFLGFSALFSVAAVLILSAVYPLFRSPDIYAEHEFKLKNFMGIVRKHTSNFFGYWGYAEDLMIASLWPITIFIAVSESGTGAQEAGVGVVATIASLVSVVVMLYVGRISDRIERRRIIGWGSIFYSLTWMFRFLARGVGGVLAFDILTKTGRAVVHVPMVSLTYDIAGGKTADNAIAYSVFYEFSLSVGKILTAVAGIAIFMATQDINYVFVLVGILTLLYSLLRTNEPAARRLTNL